MWMIARSCLLMQSHTMLGRDNRLLVMVAQVLSVLVAALYERVVTLMMQCDAACCDDIAGSGWLVCGVKWRLAVWSAHAIEGGHLVIFCFVSSCIICCAASACWQTGAVSRMMVLIVAAAICSSGGARLRPPCEKGKC